MCVNPGLSGDDGARAGVLESAGEPDHPFASDALQETLNFLA